MDARRGNGDQSKTSRQATGGARPGLRWTRSPGGAIFAVTLLLLAGFSGVTGLLNSAQAATAPPIQALENPSMEGPPTEENGYKLYYEGSQVSPQARSGQQSVDLAFGPASTTPWSALGLVLLHPTHDVPLEAVSSIGFHYNVPVEPDRWIKFQHWLSVDADGDGDRDHCLLWTQAPSDSLTATDGWKELTFGPSTEYFDGGENCAGGTPDTELSSFQETLAGGTILSLAIQTITNPSDPWPPGQSVLVDDASLMSSSGGRVQILEPGLNNCGEVTFDTINDAVACAAPGATIQATAGIYEEDVLLDKEDLTLTGAGAGQDARFATQVRPASDKGPAIDVRASGITIEHLRATGAQGEGNPGSGIRLTLTAAATSEITIQDVASTDNEGHGIAVAATVPLSDLVVRRTVLADNGMHGLRIPQSLPALDGLTVENNVLVRNGLTGSIVFGTTRTDVVFANNLYDANGLDPTGIGSGNGGAIFYNFDHGEAELVGNVFRGHTDQAVQVHGDGPSVVLRDNGFSENRRNLAVGGTGASVDARLNHWGTDQWRLAQAGINDWATGSTVEFLPLLTEEGDISPPLPTVTPATDRPTTEAGCTFDADNDGTDDLHWDGAQCRFLSLQAALAYAHADGTVVVPGALEAVDPTPWLEHAVVDRNNQGEKLTGLTLCGSVVVFECAPVDKPARWGVFSPATWAHPPTPHQGQALRMQADEGASTSLFTRDGLTGEGAPQIDELHGLGFDMMLERGACPAGSPRVTMRLDTTGDSTPDEILQVYPHSSFTCPDPGQWVHVDLLESDRWGFTTGTDQAAAHVAMGADHQILSMNLIWDGGSASDVAWFDNQRYQDSFFREPGEATCLSTQDLQCTPREERVQARDQSILDATPVAATTLTLRAQGATAQDLTARWSGDEGGDLASRDNTLRGVRVNADDVVLQRSKVLVGNVDANDHAYGVDVSGTSGVHLLGNTIQATTEGTELPGVETNSGIAAWGGADELVIRGNTITGWVSHGIAINGATAPAVSPSIIGNAFHGNQRGFTLCDTQDPVIEGNLFAGNLQAGWICETVTDGPDADAIHATITGNRFSLDAAPGTLVLDGRVEGITVDATCNDWSVYHAEAIRTVRINDAGSDNEIRITPFVGPDQDGPPFDCLDMPVAAFTASPNPAGTEDEVSFQDQSQAGSHPIVSWAWDFDDGTTSHVPEPSHRFEQAGIYEVSLTVEDAAGQAASVTQPVLVRDCVASTSGGGVVIHRDGATVGETVDGNEVPFCSIQDALDATQPGDTVLVGSGEYREAISITTEELTLCQAEATFTSCGSDPADVVVDGNGAIYPVEVFADGVTLEGFTVQNPSYDTVDQDFGPVDPSLVVVKADDVTLRNMILQDAAAPLLPGQSRWHTTGLNVGYTLDGSKDPSDRVTVEDTVIRDIPPSRGPDGTCLQDPCRTEGINNWGQGTGFVVDSVTIDLAGGGCNLAALATATCWDTGNVVGIAANDVGETVIRDSLVQARAQGGDGTLGGNEGIRGKFPGGLIENNHITGWANVGAVVWGQDLTVRANTFDKNAGGLMFCEQAGQEGTGNTFTHHRWAVLVTRCSSADDGLVLRENQMGATNVHALHFRPSMEGYTVDARLNDWGVYDHRLLPLRVDDQGTDNEVLQVPFLDVDGGSEPPLVRVVDHDHVLKGTYVGIQEAIDDPTTLGSDTVIVPASRRSSDPVTHDTLPRTPRLETADVHKAGLTLCGARTEVDACLTSIVAAQLPVIDATGLAGTAVRVSADDVTVQGLSLRILDAPSRVLDLTGDRPTIQENVIVAQGPRASEQSVGIHGAGVEGATIESNILRGSLAGGTDDSLPMGAQGIQGSFTDSLIKGNEITQWFHNGVLITDGNNRIEGNLFAEDQTALNLGGTSDNVATGNTFAGNILNPVLVAGDDSFNTLRENTFIGQARTVLFWPGTSGALLDARLNDWGLYRCALIQATFEDLGDGSNEVDFRPFLDELGEARHGCSEEDSDGDGFTNVVEWQSASNPDSVTSNPVTVATNPVVNPGFELGLLGWTPFSGTSGTTPAPDSATTRSGPTGQAAVLTAAQGDDTRLVQRFDAQAAPAGAVLGGDALVLDVLEVSQGTLTVSVCYGDETCSAGVQDHVLSEGKDVTVPLAGTEDEPLLHVSFQLTGGAQATAAFDNVRIQGATLRGQSSCDQLDLYAEEHPSDPAGDQACSNGLAAAAQGSVMGTDGHVVLVERLAAGTFRVQVQDAETGDLVELADPASLGTQGGACEAGDPSSCGGNGLFVHALARDDGDVTTGEYVEQTLTRVDAHTWEVTVAGAGGGVDPVALRFVAELGSGEQPGGYFNLAKLAVPLDSLDAVPYPTLL